MLTCNNKQKQTNTHQRLSCRLRPPSCLALLGKAANCGTAMNDPLSEQSLPPELLSYLLSFFSGEELCNLSLVATHWAQACKDDIVWVILIALKRGSHLFFTPWRKNYVRKSLEYETSTPNTRPGGSYLKSASYYYASWGRSLSLRT